MDKETHGSKADYETFDQQGKALQQVDDLYLDGEYNKEVTMRRIEQSKSIIGQQIFFMGRDLLLLKEHAKHGDFLHDLKKLSISPTTARRYISIAVKFNTPKLQKLVSSLNGEEGVFTKLLELSTESDDDLEALIDGDTVAGLQLDDIDRMTATELRHQLRKSRLDKEADKQANQRVLKEKNTHADNLASKLAKAQNLPQADKWPEDTVLFSNELAAYAEDTEKHLIMVIKIIESMGSQLQEDTPISVFQTWSKTSVHFSNRLEALVAELQNKVVQNFHGFVDQPTFILSDPLQLSDQETDES